ncbi:MAG TPA: hypothetical protein VMZ66_12450 [Aeromicrobium sp.]|nr:hypothetical protein [Aeromicrobium sp.]
MRDLLRRQLRLGAQDIDVAPLGVAGQETNDEFILLAGRFQDEIAPKVADFVRQLGGELVTNVDEAWTKPRPSAKRPVWPPSFDRNGVRI